METEDTVPEAIKFCSNTAIRRKPLTEPAPTTRQSRKLHQSRLLKRINSATNGRCQEGSSQKKSAMAEEPAGRADAELTKPTGRAVLVI